LHEKANHFSYFPALPTDGPAARKTTHGESFSFAPIIAVSVHDARLGMEVPGSKQTQPGGAMENHSPTTYSPWGRLQKKRCGMAGKQ
jgi:hypothetical protein